MKIGFNEMDTKEYRAVAMIMYSFFIAMIFFTLCRLCGWLWFNIEYKSIEIDKWLYVLINLIFKCFEGSIILIILTTLKVKYSILIGIIASIPIAFINIQWLSFLLDIIFMFSLPFVFNKDKEKSILKTAKFIIIISLYQVLMAIGRYDMNFYGKWDLGYAILSIIDYRCFLLSLMFYKIKRRLMINE